MVAHEDLEPQFTDEAADLSKPATAPAAPNKRGRRLLVTSLILLALAGGAGAGALISALVMQNPSPVATMPSAGVSTVSSGSSSANTSNASAVYQAATPSVVTITSNVTGPFGQQGQATGSGIALDTKGDIVTNDHVIKGASQITVSFSNGQTATATVVGTNLGYDLAVIKVSVASSQLRPALLGDSGTVQVGDPVYAIGSPFGLSGTLTEGIVSALNRNKARVTASDNAGSRLNNLIQTDTPINPGNSGGPLVNAKGEVIGINESIESPVDGSVGVGFAIPINLVKQLLPSLENGSNV